MQTSLYVEGGPLNSQMTESQWAHELVGGDCAGGSEGGTEDPMIGESVVFYVHSWC